MSTYNEADHARGSDGRWAPTSTSEADIDLDFVAYPHTDEPVRSVYQASAPGARLFPGDGAGTRERARVVANVRGNRHGQYLGTIGTGRDTPGGVVMDFSKGMSPVFDNAADAQRWADDSVGWASQHMTGLIGPEDHRNLIENVPCEEHSFCPKCGAVDSTSTEAQAYGDRTTCSMCDRDDYFSRGD